MWREIKKGMMFKEVKRGEREMHEGRHEKGEDRRRIEEELGREKIS